MLIPTDDLDPENRKRCQLEGWVAMDPKTGAHLRKAAGLRDFYILNAGNMALIIPGPNLQDAIKQANKGMVE
jgi:hypothetical protein